MKKYFKEYVRGLAVGDDPGDAFLIMGAIASAGLLCVACVWKAHAWTFLLIPILIPVGFMGALFVVFPMFGYVMDQALLGLVRVINIVNNNVNKKG